jgi:opacity protein-like surface antigen
MKKLYTTILIIVVTFGNSNGQSFDEGVNNISVGYGIGTFIGAIAKDYENEAGYKFTGTGPIYLKYEYGVSEKLGLGINLAYAGYEFANTASYSNDQGQEIIFNETTKYNTFSILARLNVHFGDNDKFDPYWGVGLGYRNSNWSYESSDPNGQNDNDFNLNFPFGFETTLGARYFFIPSLGAYAEVGLAKSVFQVGLTGHF